MMLLYIVTGFWHFNYIDSSIYHASDAVTVCEIASHPEKYVGKKVIVEGIYFSTPEEQLLTSENCDDRSIKLERMGMGVSRRNQERIFQKLILNKKNRLKVIFSGVLISKPLIYGCSKPNCFKYVLEMGEVLKVIK
jgi:hypothetical protein